MLLNDRDKSYIFEWFYIGKYHDLDHLAGTWSIEETRRLAWSVLSREKIKGSYGEVYQGAGVKLYLKSQTCPD
jgi:hypothetical protein